MEERPRQLVKGSLNAVLSEAFLKRCHIGVNERTGIGQNRERAVM